MKSSRLLLIVTTLAFLFMGAVSTANAGSMGNGAAQRQKLVIDSIDATAGSVVFKSMVDNSVHSYKIDAATRVSIVNVKGTVDEIKPGMKVANYLFKKGEKPGDGATLSFILVSPAPPGQ